MNQEARFKVAYMEEALDFLNQLPQKAQAKVMYTIGKSMYVLDNNLLKNLAILKSGSFARFTMAWHIGCLPFGTQKQRLWSSPRMALARKHDGLHRKRLPKQR